MMNLEEVREKLAMSCRLLYMEGLLDHAGLVGARVPGESRMVLNPRTMRGTRGRHPGIMSAEDMVVVDADGKLIEGENDPPSESAAFGLGQREGRRGPVASSVTIRRTGRRHLGSAQRKVAA